MANFTHLLSGFTQRGFPFVLKLFKGNLQQLLFLLLKSINALNCHVLFFALLHHCLDVAVTSVLLDYVVFQHFHRHWLFMVLRTAEVSWDSTEYNQLTNNVNKLWTITNICGCHTYCSQTAPAAGPGQTNTAWALPSSHIHSFSSGMSDWISCRRCCCCCCCCLNTRCVYIASF